MRPGRADMTTTRVERKTASAIECVTKTIVDPLASQIRRSSMFSRSRVISSRAPKGSSMSRSAGSKESARAIITSRCSIRLSRPTNSSSGSSSESDLRTRAAA